MYISENIMAFWETLGKSRSNDKHSCDKDSVPSKCTLHHGSVSQYGPSLNEPPQERALSYLQNAWQYKLPFPGPQATSPREGL